jgi:hypothetical protein
MSVFYPRKQTAVIAIICVMAVSGVAYYTHKNTPTASAQQAILENNTVVVEPSDADAEQSAANTASSAGTDWRKQFTDTSVPGTYKIADGNASPSEKAAPLTMTDKLSQELFTRYVELKQANLLGNTDAVNQTASDLVTSSVGSAQPRSYTEKDMVIIPASDGKSLSAFAEGVERTVELYDATESESSIMSSYLNNNDPIVLKHIDPIIANYKAIIAGLLSIPTPQSMSAYEVDLINSYGSLEFSAEALRATDTDIVRGIAGVSAHVSGVDQLTSSLLAMQSALEQQGVSFVLNDETAFNVLLN